MTDTQEIVAESFGSQGLMKTLGAELTGIDRGEVRIALLPRAELTQQDGYVHAGALTAVMDTACGFAAMTVAPPGSNVLSVEFKVNFIRLAVADRFVATGKVIKAGKTLTVCQAEMVGERGSERTTIAIMQATIFNVPGAGKSSGRPGRPSE